MKNIILSIFIFLVLSNCSQNVQVKKPGPKTGSLILTPFNGMKDGIDSTGKKGEFWGLLVGMFDINYFASQSGEKYPVGYLNVQYQKKPDSLKQVQITCKLRPKTCIRVELSVEIFVDNTVFVFSDGNKRKSIPVSKCNTKITVDFEGSNDGSHYLSILPVCEPTNFIPQFRLTGVRIHNI